MTFFMFCPEEEEEEEEEEKGDTAQVVVISVLFGQRVQSDIFSLYDRSARTAVTETTCGGGMGERTCLCQNRM